MAGAVAHIRVMLRATGVLLGKLQAIQGGEQHVAIALFVKINPLCRILSPRCVFMNNCKH